MSTSLFTVLLMSATRLFSSQPLLENSNLLLDAAQSRYLSRSLRARPGDEIVMFDGAGGELRATIATIDKSGVLVTTGERQASSIESPLAIHLVQGISRGDRMDTVVQKATELGVTYITPVITNYSVVRLDEQRAQKRQAHWQKIAQSSCEQCGRNTVPIVAQPIPLLNWFGDTPADETTRLMLRPGATTSLSAAKLAGASVTLMIGPEGGFSDTEYANGSACGFQHVTLGPRILRTETAAVAAISVAQSVWGDFAG